MRELHLIVAVCRKATAAMLHVCWHRFKAVHNESTLYSPNQPITQAEATVNNGVASSGRRLREHVIRLPAAMGGVHHFEELE